MRAVAKLRLKPPSHGSVGQNGEPSLLGGRFAAALRQLLKPTTCLIRTDIGFRRCLGIAVLFVSLASSASAAAQAPAPPARPAAPAPAAAPPQTPAVQALPAETYSYQSEDRRDPFVALTGTGSEPRSVSKKGEGPTGLAVADISVRGIMQSRGSLIAMVEGPDKKTYIVHQGDKFLDGTIKSITPQGLIVEQEVNDPLSLVKRREIRKLLRSLEDTKG